MGRATSIGVTRMRLKEGFEKIMLMRRVFVNKADETVENPITSSHGNATQAISHPATDATPVSMDQGIILLDMIQTPAQIRFKKMGCEALTTLDSRWMVVQQAKPIDKAMAIPAKQSPAIRNPGDK